MNNFKTMMVVFAACLAVLTVSADSECGNGDEGPKTPVASESQECDSEPKTLPVADANDECDSEPKTLPVADANDECDSEPKTLTFIA